MIRVLSNGEPIPENKLVVWEPITDPVQIAEAREVAEAFERNSDWLAGHWRELLPQAYGKYLAVAGQEPFLADCVEEVLALAKAAHPDDKGILLQYVIPPGTETIYGIRGEMASVHG